MTQPHSPDDELDPLTERALEWQVRLHSGEDAEGTARAYGAWRQQDPAHGEAAERAADLWRRLGGALPRRRSGPPKGVIVLLLLGLGGFWSVASGLFGPPQAWIADERTGIGERRSIILSDGTLVESDSGTSFDIAFGPHGRRLDLYTGQIYVAVQRDPTRPFEVVAETGTVRALGTAFEVRRDGAETDVFVTESMVRVTPAERADAAGIDLRAGQEVSFTASQTGKVRQGDPRSRSAWRQGQLVFDGHPLREVVAALGRYRRGRIIVMDPELGGLRVSGTFSTVNSEKALDAMEAALPIRIRRLPLLTLIQRDPERGGPDQTAPRER